MTMIVLHVEDDDLKARAVARLVTHRIKDVTIMRVRTLTEARRSLESDTIDLVISDLEFPILDGGSPQPDAGLVVLELARLRDLPIVFLSGSPKPENVAAPWFSITFSGFTETIDRMLYDARNAQAAG